MGRKSRLKRERTEPQGPCQSCWGSGRDSGGARRPCGPDVSDPICEECGGTGENGQAGKIQRRSLIQGALAALGLCATRPLDAKTDEVDVYRNPLTVDDDAFEIGFPDDWKETEFDEIVWEQPNDWKSPITAQYQYWNGDKWTDWPKKP